MRTQFRRPVMRLAFLLAIAGLYLAGCGGGTKTVTVTRTVAAHANAPARAQQQLRGLALARTCPSGESFMGCSVLPTPSSKPPSALINAPKFPDVSMWQGTVGWGAVAAWQRANGWPTGGIFKMGEFGIDPRADQNAAATMGLNWRQGYWFVRNTGCQHEGDQIIAAARHYSLHVVQLDLEVPEARGYGLCLSPRLRQAGLVVGEYTSPGSNPGGVDTSDPLWEATFGSSFSAVWNPVVAWQCTDGTFGCVTFIPGIGRDDVSYDFGISKLGGQPPPPPDPYRFYPKAVVGFGKHGHDRASEYDTVKFYDLHHCRKSTCPNTHRHLGEFAGRIWTVAHRHRPPAWTPNHRGVRFQGLWRRYNH